MKTRSEWYEWAKKYAVELGEDEDNPYYETAQLLAVKCGEFMELLTVVLEQLRNNENNADILLLVEQSLETIIEEK